MLPTETASFLRSADILHRCLTVLRAALVVLTLAVTGWLITSPLSLGQWLAQSMTNDPGGLRTGQAFGLGCVLLGHLTIWLAVTSAARRVFSALLVADPATASRAAKRTATLLWVMLVWGVLAYAAASVVATWHHPPGARSLAVTVGPAEVTTVLAALLATFTAQAFALGAALWQDHQEVI